MVAHLRRTAGVAITPQGGNTGLVGGQIPQGEILLSTERLSAVREIDPLDDVHGGRGRRHPGGGARGRRRGRPPLPLSLASEGSATVGGLISTNAGGTAVLRYGTMRALVLGLEAVLPDGELWNGLKRLRKDNTGYDLKQLLIGAEGTLGVVTAAALKLFPILPSRAVGVRRPRQPRPRHGPAGPRQGGDRRAGGGVRDDRPAGHRSGPGASAGRARAAGQPPRPGACSSRSPTPEAGAAEAALERLLAGALADGLVTDAAVAQSEAQAKAFWALREGQSAAQKSEGPAWKHDVSVPVSRVADFIADAGAALQAPLSGRAHRRLRPRRRRQYPLRRPRPPAAATGPPTRPAATTARGSSTTSSYRLGGSISAEHGLGTMKTAEALRYKAPAEVAALRAIRAALDPRRIMNPRVLF